jgi:hypothetical protein
MAQFYLLSEHLLAWKQVTKAKLHFLQPVS